MTSYYDDLDRERWETEPSKRPGRTDFERDRARVLHSAALRRLAAKTQVVEPGQSDFPRTRLTHSLECAQIGRELGKALGCDPDLVDAACLAHDLGHPPFGHNGESALDDLAGPCGGFEANAQSLRILTRLESKAFSGNGRSVGLNLTRAVLDAASKYPWPKRPGDRKYGVYPDDLEIFTWIRKQATDDRTCLEAQVMDWADDVAYSVHDFEDGVHAGHVALEPMQDRAERRTVCELAANTYIDADVGELEETFEKLLSLPFWPARYDESVRSLAALKDLTSQLIGRFCQTAEDATRAVYGAGALRRYQAELVVPRQQRRECAILKAVTAHYVMFRKGAEGMRERQREMIASLAEALLGSATASLDPQFRPAFASAETEGDRLRVIVDQIASLTDTSAIAMYERLNG